MKDVALVAGVTRARSQSGTRERRLFSADPWTFNAIRGLGSVMRRPETTRWTPCRAKRHARPTQC
ncbi:MAG: hypothetical protein H7274_03985 [Rhodoferax sp.]|nr:hypothetical protein [Rhodoferax sp.]